MMGKFNINGSKKAMMKKLFAGVVIVACAVMPVGSYAFGLPKIPGVPAAGGGAGTADVDAFLAQGAGATRLFMDAQTGLALALANKEERAKIKSEYAVVQQGLDAKDKKAGDSQKEFMKTSDALLNEKLASATTEAELKSLSADQKKEVGKSLANLGLAVLLQKQQIETGTQMVSSISSNPMMAAKALAVKDSLGTLGGNVSMGAAYLGKLPSLFKSVGISVAMPTDTSSKAEAFNPSVFD